MGRKPLKNIDVQPVDKPIIPVRVLAKREDRVFRVCSYCGAWDRDIGYHAAHCPKLKRTEDDT